ncbi:hypothetical protein NECAME_05002 [Necator americanus]|uniref:Uncharacterized protein n=1 Tax=Necator americanus TaxID=51031 RepID=W2SMU5_NECAM|nr:hypothetical protein NECAME_05002 [Necator americanus]ETN70181.1 hypothetical protein NECAME_05002 [Necator americanus]
MSIALSADIDNKVAVNGCDLLNRHELSSTQDRELQRYIDNNAHILYFKDREIYSPPKQKHRSNYAPLSRSLSHGENPLIGYNRSDANHHSPRNGSTYDQYTSSRTTPTISDPFVTPTGQRVNFTSDFPELGDGSYLDDGFSVPYKPTSPSSPYGRMTPNGGYLTPGRGGISKHSRPQSPYGSLKSRKGVSWLDQERARSLSPSNNKVQQNLTGMSQYGSAGNLSSYRDRTVSPAYTSLGKHKDDYNRFETARHKEAMRNERQKSEESRFQAFGDRPGSGVELTTHHWQGGEIITDPSQLPKSLKPRRLYYSPIGDGTVAADGIELKRRPVDLSPRVTITQMQHVDRGHKGHDGLNVFEKSWTNPMGSHPGSEAGYGSDFGGGPGSGRNSRADALSPSGDPYGKGSHGGPHGANLGGPGGYGPGGGPGGYGPGGGPGTGGGYGSGRGTPSGPGAGDGYGGGPGSGGYGGGPGSGGYGGGPGSGRPGSGLGGRGDPYSTLDSRSGHPYGSNGNLGPGNDGRMSVASSVFSDPSYRFDTKTGYLITNPRELIHQYATTTPVAVMDPTDNTPSTTTITKQSLYRKSEETTEERFSPYAPYKSAANVPSPNKFVRQLRDETLTHSQREANAHIDPLNQRDAHAEQRISEIRSKTHTSRGGNDDIDSLTQQLVHGLQSSARY